VTAPAVFSDVAPYDAPGGSVPGNTAENRIMFGNLLADATSDHAKTLLVRQSVWLSGDGSVMAAVFVDRESLDYDGWLDRATGPQNKWSRCAHMTGPDGVSLAARFSAHRDADDAFAPFEAVTGLYRGKGLFGPQLPFASVFFAGDGTEHAGTALTSWLTNEHFGPALTDADLADDWSDRIAPMGALQQPPITVRLREKGYDADPPPKNSTFTRYTPKNRRWRIDGSLPATAPTQGVLRAMTQAAPSILLWTRPDGKLAVQDGASDDTHAHRLADMTRAPAFVASGRRDPVKLGFRNYEDDFAADSVTSSALQTIDLDEPGTHTVTAPRGAVSARVTLRGAQGGKGGPAVGLSVAPGLTLPGGPIGPAPGGEGGEGHTAGQHGGAGFMAINAAAYAIEIPGLAQMHRAATSGAYAHTYFVDSSDAARTQAGQIWGRTTRGANINGNDGALFTGGGGGGGRYQVADNARRQEWTPAFWACGAGAGQGGSSAVLIDGDVVLEARGGGGAGGRSWTTGRFGYTRATFNGRNCAYVGFVFSQENEPGEDGEVITRTVAVTAGAALSITIGAPGSAAGAFPLTDGSDALQLRADTVPDPAPGSAIIEWLAAHVRDVTAEEPAPLIVVPAHAKRAAAEIRRQRGLAVIEYVLPPKFLGVEPGDGVTLDLGPGGDWTGRIINIGYNAGMDITVVAQVERA